MKFLLTNKELEIMRDQMIREYIDSDENRMRRIEASISQRGKCAVYFNFSDPNVVVFSVERIDHGTLNERTTIGYYLKAAAIHEGADEKKVIKEWALLCSREQHNQLVEEFNKSTSKKLLKG